MDEKNFFPFPLSGSLIPVTRVKFTPGAKGAFDVMFEATAPDQNWTPITVINPALGDLSDALQQLKFSNGAPIDISRGRKSTTVFVELSSGTQRIEIAGVYKRGTTPLLLLSTKTGPIYINLSSENPVTIGEWLDSEEG